MSSDRQFRRAIEIAAEKSSRRGGNHDYWHMTKQHETELENNSGLARPCQYLRLEKFWILILLLFALIIIRYGSFRVLFDEMSTKSEGPSNHLTLHLQLPHGWSNGPNALFVDASGTWHVYFEAEASERPHDCKTWGHATSLDLYSWTEEPIAIVCSEYSIGRGSIVIDTNNTSGLFTNQTNGVLAFYTRQIDVEKTSELAMACSTDGGYTFAKSSSVDLFLDCSGSQGLSDPKVTWHQPSESWVMTVTPISSPTVMFYISQNLVDWTWASDFTCPDLMKRGSRLESPSLVSIPRLNSTGAEDRNHPVNPGGTVLDFGDYILLLTTSRECPWDHSSETLYFPGIFNGTHFHPTDWRADRFIDFGPDNHDTQFFFGRPDGEPVISLGAASNTHFRKPTHGEFGSHQSVSLTGPRGGYLVPGPGEGDLSYFSYPVGLGELRSQVQANFSLREESSKTIAFNGSKALVVTARFEMQPPDEATVEINLDVVFRSSSGRDRILCTIIFGTWTADFGCDRSHVHDGSLSGNPGLQQMSARQVRPLLPFHNPSVRRWELQAILDRAILETYLNGGVASGTLIFSPEALLDLIDFQTSDVPTWADLQVIVQETEAT